MKRGEQRLQTAIVVALRKRFDCFVFHVPNGGARTVLEAMAFKDAGTTAGVPDLVATGPEGRIGFLEIKDHVQVRERAVDPFERLLTLDPAQKTVVSGLRGRGFQVAVIDSVDDAVAALDRLGFPARGPVPTRSGVALGTGF
jgi:hypothetical protein